MAELAIKDEYIDMLGYLGEPDKLANFAIKDFLVKSYQEKLSNARRRVQAYEKKYAISYEEFKRKIQSNEDYVNKIEEEVEKLWEDDLLDWEYQIKEIDEWKERLKNIFPYFALLF